MKLIRGFLAYFMWTRWMEGMSETLVELWGQVGGLQDLEAALRTSGSLGSLSIFDFAAGWTSLFFALSPLW